MIPVSAPGPARPCPQPTQVEPLTAELRRIHVTVSRRLLDKLAAARDALSHSHPGATDDEILEVGLDLVIARHRKRRGIGAKPRTKSPGKALPTPAPAAPTSPSHHVPAAVWRGVWERDGGRCAWPLENGVCGSTRRLELDHVKGWALGAGTTVDECRLLCRHHQDVSARHLYGNDLMDRYTRPKGGTCSEPPAVYGAADPSWLPLRGAPSGTPARRRHVGRATPRRSPCAETPRPKPRLRCRTGGGSHRIRCPGHGTAAGPTSP